jgi:hypothetical protein
MRTFVLVISAIVSVAAVPLVLMCGLNSCRASFVLKPALIRPSKALYGVNRDLTPMDSRGR